jgi:hypothetical protein
VAIATFGLAIRADTNCTSGQTPLYGVWSGELEGRQLTMAVKPDGTCTISFKDQASGAVETLSGTFETDFSKRPVPLSIRNIPSLDHPLHTILEFSGRKTIRMAPYARRWRLRPVWFDTNRSVTLTKQPSDRRPKE